LLPSSSEAEEVIPLGEKAAFCFYAAVAYPRRLCWLFLAAGASFCLRSTPAQDQLEPQTFFPASKLGSIRSRSLPRPTRRMSFPRFHMVAIGNSWRRYGHSWNEWGLRSLYYHVLVTCWGFGTDSSDKGPQDARH